MSKVISKKTLAVVKALEECYNSIFAFDLIFDIEYRVQLLDSDKRERLLTFNIYFEYFSDLVKYIDSAKILPGMVPKVAKEAGFGDLVDYNTPIEKENILSGYWIYQGQVPNTVIESFNQNPKPWLQAFAKVTRDENNLPSFAEFVRDDSFKKYRSEYTPIRSKALSSALLNEDLSEDEWDELLKFEYPEKLTPDELEDFIRAWGGNGEIDDFIRVWERPHHNSEDTERDTKNAEKILNCKIQENMKLPLRAKYQDEKIFGSNYRSVEVVEQRQDTLSIIEALAFAGCDTPIVEALIHSQVFDVAK